jgi:glycerol kinase
MEKDTLIRIEELRVDGGASANDLLMQFQSDLLQVPVVRPKVIETTALGAAFFAGLAVGFWKNEEEIRGIWRADRVFEPQMSADEAQHRRGRWNDALARSRDWDKPKTPPSP